MIHMLLLPIRDGMNEDRNCTGPQVDAALSNLQGWTKEKAVKLRILLIHALGQQSIYDFLSVNDLEIKPAENLMERIQRLNGILADRVAIIKS